MSHELQIVTGKGGTGKTTVACALAYAHALRGRRALVCEVEGRTAIGDLFGVTMPAGAEVTLLRTMRGGEVRGLSVDARSALWEYLNKHFKLGIAGRALEKFGVVEFATSIAPGLSDVLVTGKVYEAVRRGLMGRAEAYDVVILDAPPTGRIAQFLNVHRSVTDLAKVGPIHAQARSVMELFTSPTTVIHLTTLLEDMPVTETLEAVHELAETRIPLGSIICTMTSPPLTGEGALADDELLPAAAGHLTVTGLDDPTLEADLSRLLTVAATAKLEEQAQNETLATAGLPLVDLPRLPEGVDRDGLAQLAAWLDEDLIEGADR
ncbi:ArsA-related P-loop ATPase [Mariniluteicoccus endophyticus]